VSRDTKDLTPRMQLKADLFKFKMQEQVAIPFMITSTYRSQEEQDAIYNQGRATPGKIVTWTRSSRHTQRDAFDIALLRDGKPVWDTKVDVDEDHVPDKVGESCGLEWGGSWKNPDYPHMQDNGKDLEVS
jgi:peptidoglycan L-alanyl-D-glutamate endopeptidase CwlK